jgi:hypothetical protein
MKSTVKEVQSRIKGTVTSSMVLMPVQYMSLVKDNGYNNFQRKENANITVVFTMLVLT